MPAQHLPGQAGHGPISLSDMVSAGRGFVNGAVPAAPRNDDGDSVRCAARPAGRRYHCARSEVRFAVRKIRKAPDVPRAGAPAPPVRVRTSAGGSDSARNDAGSGARIAEARPAAPAGDSAEAAMHRGTRSEVLRAPAATCQHGLRACQPGGHWHARTRVKCGEMSDIPENVQCATAASRSRAGMNYHKRFCFRSVAFVQTLRGAGHG